jgi:predicted HAD superfamily Cof-like phosphohydrolase
LTNFERVVEFHERFGHPVGTVAKLPGPRMRELRDLLVDEERQELKQAFDNDDLVEVADALTDLLYVVYGYGAVCGIDLDECFKEVHRSNMSKLGPDGKPVLRPDGKILKGPQYSPPDLGPVLKGTIGLPVSLREAIIGLIKGTQSC